MIVCSCRAISDRDYETKQALYERLLQDDRQCCSCIREIKQELKQEADDE